MAVGASALIGLLSSVVSGAISSSAHKDFESGLRDLYAEQDIAPEYGQALDILRTRAGEGQKFTEQMKADVGTDFATTLNQLRDNPDKLMGALVNLYPRKQRMIREIEYEDARQRGAGEDRLAGFLGGTVAPARDRSNFLKTQIKFGELQEAMQRKKDTAAFTQAGAGSLDISNLLGSGDLSSWFSTMFAPQGQNPYPNAGASTDYGFQGYNPYSNIDQYFQPTQSAPQPMNYAQGVGGYSGQVSYEDELTALIQSLISGNYNR